MAAKKRNPNGSGNIAQRKDGFMPPLATSIVDTQAVQLMDEWIKQLKAAPAKPKD